MLPKARPGGTRLRIGFLRLTDSAPAIVAQEFGGLPMKALDVELHCGALLGQYCRQTGLWLSGCRGDRAAFGLRHRSGSARDQPVALIVPCNLSLGGNTVTLASAILGAAVGRET